MVFLVVGDANADVSGALARFPHEGDDSPLSDLVWTSGGSAANVATALARLGAAARLLVRVGVDPAADVALGAAAAAGVDLGAVQRDATVATGLCFAAVSPGGERTFFSHRGANVALAMPLDGELRDVGWLHLGAHALLEGRQRETRLRWSRSQRSAACPFRSTSACRSCDPRRRSSRRCFPDSPFCSPTSTSGRRSPCRWHRASPFTNWAPRACRSQASARTCAFCPSRSTQRTRPGAETRSSPAFSWRWSAVRRSRSPVGSAMPSGA